MGHKTKERIKKMDKLHGALFALSLALALFMGWFYLDAMISKAQLFDKEQAIAKFSKAEELIRECREREDTISLKLFQSLNRETDRQYMDEVLLNYFSDKNQLSDFEEYAYQYATKEGWIK